MKANNAPLVLKSVHSGLAFSSRTGGAFLFWGELWKIQLKNL